MVLLYGVLILKIKLKTRYSACIEELETLCKGYDANFQFYGGAHAVNN